MNDVRGVCSESILLEYSLGYERAPDAVRAPVRRRADWGAGMSPHGTFRAADGGSATRRPGGRGRTLGLGLRLAVSGGRDGLGPLGGLAVAVRLALGPP